MTTTHELVTFLHETADEVERLRDLPDVLIDMGCYCELSPYDNYCRVCLAGVHLYKLRIFNYPDEELTGLAAADHPGLGRKLHALDELRRNCLSGFVDYFPDLDPELQYHIAKYREWSKGYYGVLLPEEIDTLIDDVRRFADYIESKAPAAP